MIAGRYSLDSEIGRGGMGVVWRGEDQVLGREVALKRIGMAPGGASPDLLRAEREARLAATLNHPNVVSVFDLVVVDDEHWLVMEYVASRNLAEVVSSGGPLPPDSAAQLLAQAADALAAAHGSGIVHRDVKPSNILVTPQGRVKLTDFGIARTSQDATLTQTGMVTGSPAYIAPEVASGGQATAASDVWSLGATLFHALAGRPPYDVKDNMMAALYRIVHEDPPRLPEAGWLTPVLEATMTHDPARRWTMAQVRDYLVAGPDNAATRVTPAATATMPLTAAAAATPDDGGTAETPQLAATPREPRPPREPSRPREPRGRRRLTGWLVGGAAALVAALLVWLAVESSDGPADEAAPSGPATSASESTEPTPSATSTDVTESTESPSETSESATEQELVSFGKQYVPTAISDRDTAWQMLTPAFQEQSGGRGGYDRWWGQFESAQIEGVTADPEAMTVSYTATYTRTDGSVLPPDDVSLQLVEQGGDLLIAGES